MFEALELKNSTALQKLDGKAASAKQPKPKHSRHDQEDRHDIIEKPGHDQNENACEEGDDRLQMRNGEGHGLSLQKQYLEKPKAIQVGFCVAGAKSPFKIEGHRSGLGADDSDLSTRPTIDTNAEQDTRQLA
jgi:hypothetical protein